ncbi:MAG TPA: MgtC/SapB family protein [Pyrinomonadaceae bacterium]|nr:MgtC/SapB family protein [Pyrinomonadaceae bacterium]
MLEADLNIFLRIVIITVLAGALGWERESAGKAAGLRTHVLVGIAAVLFVVVGDLMIKKFSVYGELMRFDPASLVGAVVTGISFLGAGMIFFNRNNSRIKGLTTAAGILTTAAIGMIVGLERYILAIGSTVIVFVVLHFVAKFEDRYLQAEGNAEQNNVKNEEQI